MTGRTGLIVPVILLIGASAAGGGDASPTAPPAPAAVVQAFYTQHFAHDMAFTEASVQAKAVWLAPDLVERCRTYLKKPVSPDEVPDINGDPFTDSQEYPTSFRVGKPTISGTSARVPVVLSWKGRTRTIVVQLAQLEGKWLISDFAYDSGSLRALLSSGS